MKNQFTIKHLRGTKSIPSQREMNWATLWSIAWFSHNIIQYNLIITFNFVVGLVGLVFLKIYSHDFGIQKKFRSEFETVIKVAEIQSTVEPGQAMFLIINERFDECYIQFYVQL